MEESYRVLAETTSMPNVFVMRDVEQLVKVVDHDNGVKYGAKALYYHLIHVIQQHVQH